MDTLSTLLDWVVKFLWHVAPAVTGVALGGFLVNRFFVRKANLAALVERVCDALGDLRTDAAEYWPVDAPAEDENDDLLEHAALEAKISGHTLTISALVAILEEKYVRLPLSDSTRVMELIDAATGGDFQTAGRKADKGRYIRILRCAGRLAAALQRLKV